MVSVVTISQRASYYDITDYIPLLYTMSPCITYFMIGSLCLFLRFTFFSHPLHMAQGVSSLLWATDPALYFLGHYFHHSLRPSLLPLWVFQALSAGAQMHSP